MKRQTTEWGKAFPKHISDKGLISKERLNDKKTIQVKNEQRTKTFFQRRYTNGQKEHAVLSHYGNATQNPNEIPLYTH